MAQLSMRSNPSLKAVMLPCLVCGKPHVQDLRGNRRQKPCNTPECVKLQEMRKAEFKAIVGPVEKERPEPSEQSQRGGHVLISESIDTVSGLAEALVGDEDVPDDPETVIDPEDKSTTANKKRVALKREQLLDKVKRSPTLEQPSVAAEINPGNPKAPYSYDLETDLVIRPPVLGHTAAHLIAVPPPEQKPISLYSPPQPPRPDPARSLWNAPMRPLGVVVEPEPLSVVERIEEDVVRRLLNIPVKRTLGNVIPLSSTATAWSSTNPNDVRNYNKELIENANKTGRVPASLPAAGTLPPTAPATDIPSLRRMIGITREQIASWITMPEILFRESSVRTVCDKEIVSSDPAVNEFEETRAANIAALEKEIADAQNDIDQINRDRDTSGLDGRVIRGMINDIRRKRIAPSKAKITLENRRKAPEPIVETVEVDVPGTEHAELVYSKPVFDQQSLDLYKNDLAEMSIDGDEHVVFENAVILRAAEFEHIRAQYPTMAECVSVAFPDIVGPLHDNGREEDHHEEADSHAMGLRIRGKGRKTTGRAWHNEALETFDGVYPTHRGAGSPGDSGGGHQGCPDFDPSDDTQ
jgi:hypothetical protein